jgi:Domain of unknown function (DUF4145)
MQNNTVWPIRKFTCPYCDAICAFDCVYSARGYYSGYFYPVSVWACHNCDRALFVRNTMTEFDHISRQELRVESVLPATEPNVDQRIPDGIAVDFVEASRDYNIASYKSAAVMARRTVQKMCLNLGATPGTKLHQQIDELKINSKLHSDLADIATEIRYLGNDGAHPEDDAVLTI